MSQAYFIGGAPRIGKTTLTLRFIKAKPMLAASTDAIRYALRRAIKQEDQPDLFNSGKFTSNNPERRQYLESHVDEIIELQNRESAVVWQSVNNFVKSNLEDGFDVLIEGVAVLPEFLKNVDYNYSAVFLGNQSEEHAAIMLNAARNNPNDWMHGLEDETVRVFAKFNQSFSRFVAVEAAKYNMSYFEIDDNNFEESINNSLETLLS